MDARDWPRGACFRRRQRRQPTAGRTNLASMISFHDDDDDDDCRGRLAVAAGLISNSIDGRLRLVNNFVCFSLGCQFFFLRRAARAKASARKFSFPLSLSAKWDGIHFYPPLGRSKRGKKREKNSETRVIDSIILPQQALANIGATLAPGDVLLLKVSS